MESKTERDLYRKVMRMSYKDLLRKGFLSRKKLFVKENMRFLILDNPILDLSKESQQKTEESFAETFDLIDQKKKFLL